MASELSNYLANLHLNWVKGTDMPNAPATVYVGLFNGDPTPTGLGGSDVTATVRTAGRVAVAFGAVANRVVMNNANVDFGAAAAGATITHAALYDAQTGGNMLYFTELDTTRTVIAGDPIVIPVGDLSVNYN